MLIARQRGLPLMPAEQQEWENWLKAHPSNEAFIGRCLDEKELAASLERLESIDDVVPWDQFKKNIGQLAGTEEVPVVSIRRRSWKWLVAASTVGLLIASGWFFLGRKASSVQEPKGVIAKGEDIQPGAGKATLTLGDGRIITLSDRQDGLLAQENGASVSKLGDGLVYDPSTSKKGTKEAIVQHTVATPVGGYYELTLPDRTKVWLNADTRISYPTAFVGKERRITVEGEIYLEVAKYPNKPFIVTTGATEVKVLGTHFNIRNYPDEPVCRTTLLEGSVQVGAQGSQVAVLRPGQQAAVATAAQADRAPRIVVADVEAVIAWKNGFFDFRAAGFEEVMKELQRWYVGIKAVDIRTPVRDKFTAAIPRNVPLSTMLTILQETSKVHFTMVDRTIIVTP